ncbi:cadherin-related family member 1-like [Mytilus trossulus]|uniref:cadherin-related family member 1-like n=1 Tax=Mytilus trossulus TaxID=6551 RepID=UPI0030051CC9
MAVVLKFGILCILIISLFESGISQRSPPIFDSSNLLQFSEGCSTRILATVTARGYNGVIIISANDYATRAKVDVLQTSSDNSAGFSTTVQIKQKACMDRETESVWYLQLLAEDSTNMKSIETLQIYIIDVNDEHPSFSSKHFQITVSEKTLPSTEVIKVTATDPDNGIGGVVRYTLEPEGPVSIKIAIEHTNWIYKLVGGKQTKFQKRRKVKQQNI